MYVYESKDADVGIALSHIFIFDPNSRSSQWMVTKGRTRSPIKSETKDGGCCYSKHSHKGTKGRCLDRSKTEHKMNRATRLLRTLHIITQILTAPNSAWSAHDQMTGHLSVAVIRKRGGRGRDVVTGFHSVLQWRSGRTSTNPGKQGTSKVETFK